MRRKRGGLFSIKTLIIILVIAAIFGSVRKTDDGDTKVEGTEPVETSAEILENSQKNENEPEDEPEITEEEYRSECKALDYKELCRYPDNYTGAKITIKVKVQQTMDASLFGEQKAWRAYTDNSGYGIYLDDEYYLLDDRGDGAVKILDEDIIVVYGEFTGVKKVTRALTGTSDEVPSIDVKYLDLVE